MVRDNHLAYNLFGIWLNRVKDVRIAGNMITGKRDFASAQRGNGIQLYNTTGAQIVGNNISFVRDGIYVDVSHHALFRDNRIHHVRYGTHYMNSYHNVWEGNESYLNRGGLALMEVRNQIVRDNRAWGNTDHGIMLRTIQDSTIEDNVVAGNGRGFFIYDAEYNTLRGNVVIGNRVGRASVGRIDPQPGGGQRLHLQPRADALRGFARRALGREHRQLLEQLHGLGCRRRWRWATCRTRPKT